MPITAGSFDRLIIECSCASLEALAPGYVLRYNAASQRWWDKAGPSVQRLPWPQSSAGGYDLTNEEIQIVLAAIRTGAAQVYYVDEAALAIPYNDLPDQFAPIHQGHPFHPTDGYKISPSLIKRGELVEESSGARHIEYKGGFIPSPPAIQGVTYDVPLSDVTVFRNGIDGFGFRIVIPSSLEVARSDLVTYAPVLAFIRWLNTYRTEGDAVPDHWASAVGPFSGRKFRIPTDPDNLNARPADWVFDEAIFTTTAVGSYVVTVTLFFNLENYDTGTDGASIVTDFVSLVVGAASGTIPAVGQSIEPPFGNAEVAAHARKLVSNDGTLIMAGGLVLAQWRDPGEQVQRMMPLSGFGRTVNYNDCPSRLGGGRWVPRPEERPRADLIEFDGGANTGLYFEDAVRAVGYSGTDRIVAILNRPSSTAALNVYAGLDIDNPQLLLSLRPGERMTVRAVFELNGTSEFVVEQAPNRYCLSAGAIAGVDTPYYSITLDGIAMRFRPWFPNGNRIRRRDADEFSIGTADAHSNGDALSDGLANSSSVITVKHAGDLIFYENVSVELTGSGILPSGHSAALVRQRVGAPGAEVAQRFYTPQLSGLPRTYITPFIGECEAGDRYVSGLLYPESGTTISFNNLQVNAISQIFRVAPHISI